MLINTKELKTEGSWSVLQARGLHNLQKERKWTCKWQSLELEKLKSEDILHSKLICHFEKKNKAWYLLLFNKYLVSGVKETFQMQICTHTNTLICIFYTSKEAGFVHLKNTGDFSTYSVLYSSYCCCGFYIWQLMHAEDNLAMKFSISRMSFGLISANPTHATCLTT